MKIKWLNKNNIKSILLYSFGFGISFLALSFLWKYAPYSINEEPNYDNYIGFIYIFYISMTFFSIIIFFLIILIIIYFWNLFKK